MSPHRVIAPPLTPALVAVISTFFYGKFLDNARMSPRRRAWWGMVLWLIPQTIGLVWMCIMWNHVYPTKVAIDYGATPGKWAAAYFPFLLVFGSGFWVQIYLYWVLGTFTSDVKAASRVSRVQAPGSRWIHSGGEIVEFQAESPFRRTRDRRNSRPS